MLSRYYTHGRCFAIDEAAAALQYLLLAWVLSQPSDRTLTAEII